MAVVCGVCAGQSAQVRRGRNRLCRAVKLGLEPTHERNNKQRGKRRETVEH
jgi:hypothetical protein